MSVKVHKGHTKFEYLPVTPSTEFAADSLVASSSGQLIPATSTIESYEIIGIIRHAIASTDADYADERRVEVEIPTDRNVEYEIAVTSGLVVADVNLYQDLTDASTVNRGASTYDIAQCKRVISTTLGIFRLNIGTEARRKAAS